MGFLCKGSRGLLTIGEGIQVENEAVTIPAQVRWLSHRQTLRERDHRRYIRESTVVFVGREKMTVQRLVNSKVTSAAVT
jgi:hypothetical protein